MNVEIKSETRRYHVGFKQDRFKKFKKGPNKGRPQTVTTCKIFLLTEASGPTLVSKGVTTLGKQDTDSSYEGCKMAFERALSSTYFSKRETTAFWKEFRLRHRLCSEAFSNVGGSFFGHTGGPVHGYAGLYSHQKRMIDKMIVMGNPSGGSDHFRKMYMHRRHEYRDIADKDFGKSPTGRAARTYHGSGVTIDIRKIYGLGWKKIVDDHTGVQIWPRTQAQKREQLRRMYSPVGAETAGETILHPTKTDYAELEKRIMAQVTQRNERTFSQAEDRCHRVGEPVTVTIVNTVDNAEVLEKAMGGEGAKRIAEILKEADRYKQQQRAWLHGVWAIADDQLTAKMRWMQGLLSAQEFAKADALLLSRPGITRELHDEYVIDPDEFVSEFEVGDMVTWKDGGLAKIIEVDTIRVTIQPVVRVFGGYTAKLGTTETVMDWEVVKKVGWWERVRDAVGSMIRGHVEAAAAENDKIEGRGLWEQIDADYCAECERTPARGFLRGPEAGNCLNIKCSFCGQKYWVDPASRTAKLID